VAKLDRLARSMVHFWGIWQQLEAKKVSLRVLDMPGLGRVNAKVFPWHTSHI